MTDPDYTALLLVIDRSGSMTSIRDDMVGGLTTMLGEQASHGGRVTVDIGPSMTPSSCSARWRRPTMSSSPSSPEA